MMRLQGVVLRDPEVTQKQLLHSGRDPVVHIVLKREIPPFWIIDAGFNKTKGLGKFGQITYSNFNRLEMNLPAQR